jgi:hypothetical protein
MDLETHRRSTRPKLLAGNESLSETSHIPDTSTHYRTTDSILDGFWIPCFCAWLEKLTGFFAILHLQQVEYVNGTALTRTPSRYGLAISISGLASSILRLGDLRPPSIMFSTSLSSSSWARFFDGSGDSSGISPPPVSSLRLSEGVPTKSSSEESPIRLPDRVCIVWPMFCRSSLSIESNC